MDTPQPVKSKRRRVCWILVTVLLLIVGGAGLSVYLYEDDFGCNVVGVKIQGPIETYGGTIASDGSEVIVASSEDIIKSIRDAEDKDSIKAILVQIDSAGGYPVASEELATAIRDIKKPNVGLIREYGTSGAYWAASAADWLIASKLSTIGSIGITSSYIDYAKQNTKEGITYNQLSTGKFKDMQDPEKPLTDEERKLIERDLAIANEQFIATVAENRKLAIDSVRALADGSSMLGEAAKEKGLIDQLGGYDEAKKHLEKKIGEPVEVCWK